MLQMIDRSRVDREGGGGEHMEWARVLAYIAETVDQQLLFAE